MADQVVYEQVTLGALPYILIEVEPHDDHPDDDESMQLRIKAGAGAHHEDTIVAVLLVTVEQLTGVPSADYEAAIEAAQNGGAGL